MRMIEKSCKMVFNGPKKTTLACASLMYTGGFFYNVIMPLSLHITTNHEKNNSERIPEFPGYDVFFDVPQTTTCEIVVSLMYLYCVFVMYTVLVCSNNLGILFVSHLNSQLQILIRYINEFENIKIKNHEKINNLVSQHTRSIRFIDLVSNILYEICLADVIISTMLICLGEYSILQMWRNHQIISVITYSILLLALALSPLIFCCLSEIVSEQFSNVGNCSYELEWHTLPHREQLSFILIILNAQTPRKISAGIMDLSFVSFISVYN
uniref:Olfactory receptor 82 n=1 Tax=Aulacocentrum confusum TaxID=2767324 RepID=A0A7G8Z9A1_9HYME|nr:olfactory receptor 82 [Aulacocentrum confusum]